LVTETFLNKDETIKINKVVDIRNPTLKTKFDNFRNGLKGLGMNDPIMKVHGTTDKHLEGI
jgi:hypothetical protein